MTTPFEDPRPLRWVLNDWMERHRLSATTASRDNGGPITADKATIAGWLSSTDGCPYDRELRALLTLYDQARGIGDSMRLRPELKYPINLLEDKSVATRDGEVFGKWHYDKSNDILEFTPEGSSEPVLRSRFMPDFCGAIRDWLRSRT